MNVVVGVVSIFYNYEAVIGTLLYYAIAILSFLDFLLPMIDYVSHSGFVLVAIGTALPGFDTEFETSADAPRFKGDVGFVAGNGVDMVVTGMAYSLLGAPDPMAFRHVVDRMEP